MEESNRFLADRSPKAYEAAVDRLLADKRYGERWGRHWMDVWRYSDWYGWRKGNDVRNSHRFMWRWRDWIIESLNSDKGYDRMILEMLAADEIAPNDTNALRATGFLARNYAQIRSKRMDAGRGRPHVACFPGHHREMRALPRSQVRPALAGRILSTAEFLRAV